MAMAEAGNPVLGSVFRQLVEKGIPDKRQRSWGQEQVSQEEKTRRMCLFRVSAKVP